MSDRSCPVCHTPFSSAWILLAEKARFDQTQATHLCPQCTAAVGMSESLPSTATNHAHYRNRVWSGPPASWLQESEDGDIVGPTPQFVVERLRERVATTQHAVTSPSARVLEVGCRDGLGLETLARHTRLNVMGLEPWSSWAQQAKARGLAIETTPLEDWTDDRRFDVIVEYDLIQHLPNPIQHLHHIAQRLTDDGLAIIETPNLIGSFGDLLDDILRADSPVVYTPRALATACLQAGLHPIEVHAEAEIRMICRRTSPAQTILQSGPSAMEVAHLAWGNDLRRGVKQALVRRGPTRDVVRTATRIHRRCPSPGARADIAIELANQFERTGDYHQAIKWLKRSLIDRTDPQVQAALDQLRGVMAVITHDTTPHAGLRLAS